MNTYLRMTVPSALICAFSIISAAPAQAELRFEHVMNIGSSGTGPGQFKYVEDFAISADGKHLLATDAAHAFVQVFDKTTGEYVSRFGGKGDFDENLEKPEGIAVDPQGNIFVADYTTGYVKKYDKDYNWLQTFSEYGSGPGQNFKSEFISIFEGRLYLPEVGNHEVDVFDLDGKFLFSFDAADTPAGKLNNPEAAKANSRGDIYISDLKNDRMMVFDRDGKFKFTWGRTGSGPGEFKAPAGVGIDKHDNVYVSEIGNDRMQVFDRNGNFLTMWGKAGSGNGEFGNLHGVLVDRATGWIYIADSANDRIQVYKPGSLTQ